MTPLVIVVIDRVLLTVCRAGRGFLSPAPPFFFET
jgi:hypothetical protein